MGTSNGSIFVLDVHNGAVVAQVQFAQEDSILELTWNCPRFKMEEPTHHENNVTRSSTGFVISFLMSFFISYSCDLQVMRMIRLIIRPYSYSETGSSHFEMMLMRNEIFRSFFFGDVIWDVHFIIKQLAESE